MENPLLAEPDTSRGRFRFRTPSLRNVGLTGPYMHNGMLTTLEDVLVFYDNGRSENPNAEGRFRQRHLVKLTKLEPARSSWEGTVAQPLLAQ